MIGIPVIIHPYLYFDGDCEAAIRFYAEVFSGDVAALSRYAEQPGDVPGDDAERIMHATVNLGDTALMASDVPTSMTSFEAGDNVHLSTSPGDLATCERVFAALADGGRVGMPFEQQFWGAWMGNVTDRFGVHWMISHAGDPD